MLKIRKIAWGLLLLTFAYANIHAVIPEKVEEIRKQLSLLTDCSYTYTVRQTYPDGEVIGTKGKIIVSKDYFCEQNDKQLTIQTKSWYYKLDHANKVVYVTSLERKNKTGVKPKYPQPLSMIPDSIINKYGQITYAMEGKIEKVDISFGSRFLVKKIHLEYNSDKKIPKLFAIESKVFYEINSKTMEEVYLPQVMTATDFSLSPAQKKENLDDYFRIENGKVKLKKYANYRLIQ